MFNPLCPTRSYVSEPHPMDCSPGPTKGGSAGNFGLTKRLLTIQSESGLTETLIKLKPVDKNSGRGIRHKSDYQHHRLTKRKLPLVDTHKNFSLRCFICPNALATETVAFSPHSPFFLGGGRGGVTHATSHAIPSCGHLGVNVHVAALKTPP